MLKNYLVTALRTLRKHPVYATLNVAGLAIGMACCLVIGLYVLDQLSYDRFHEHADRIYRVTAASGDAAEPTNANGGFSYGPALEAAFPEIEHAVRFVKTGWGEERVFARGDRRFYERDLFFADPDVFEVFSFPFAAGDPTTALVEPHTIVLTAAMAEKYFPGEDPLDQAIQVDPFNDGRFTDYRVTGVLAALPGPSHIPFDFLLSYASLPPLERPVWGFEPAFTYLLLREGADPAALEARFADFQARVVGDDPQYGLHLQPLLDIHLRSNLNAELQPNGNITFVYLFSLIALFVLLLACVNFMNLATARSAQRAKEVGLRKAIGARRSQLVGQFLGEALLLSVAGAGLALALAAALLPAFNGIAGTSLTLAGAGAPLLLALAGLALVVGVVAGSYPALFLSGFDPAGVLKGGASGGRGAARLREALVVFQFAVSIGLIACTAVVSNQMAYARQAHLGFDREQIVVLPLNDAIRSNETAFRAELLRAPGIESVSLSEQVPARAGNGAGFKLEGVNGPDDDDWFGAYRLFTDLHFVETYGLEVLAGRGFSPTFPSDSTEAFIVNAATVEAAGWDGPEAALGKTVMMSWAGIEKTGEVVGVVRDFNVSSLRDSVFATILIPMPTRVLNFVSARVAPGRTAETLAHLRATWAGLAPDYPFAYYFLDDDFDRLHRADERLGQVFQAFALLAVVVAGLGLFGLAAFVAEQRTKEVGVRKVLGASVPGLVALLSKDFMRLVLLAFAVAAPVAWLAMGRWLDGFVYRPDLTAWPFVLAGAAALLIALLTVSVHALRAATADPVQALRYE